MTRAVTSRCVGFDPGVCLIMSAMRLITPFESVFQTDPLATLRIGFIWFALI
jgi:hypothetical protein